MHTEQSTYVIKIDREAVFTVTTQVKITYPNSVQCTELPDAFFDAVSEQIKARVGGWDSRVSLNYAEEELGCTPKFCKAWEEKGASDYYAMPYTVYNWDDTGLGVVVVEKLPNYIVDAEF